MSAHKTVYKVRLSIFFVSSAIFIKSTKENWSIVLLKTKRSWRIVRTQSIGHSLIRNRHTCLPRTVWCLDTVGSKNVISHKHCRRHILNTFLLQTKHLWGQKDTHCLSSLPWVTGQSILSRRSLTDNETTYFTSHTRLNLSPKFKFMQMWDQFWGFTDLAKTVQG